MSVAICPYCQQDTAGNHAWNCPMNPVNINNGEFNKCEIKKSSNYSHYHLSWLQFAIENFKNQNGISHMIENDIKMGEFIKLWAKDELSKIIEV